MEKNGHKRLKDGGGKALRDISPAQRAAIVIAMLGEERAKPIVEKLDDAALAKVAFGLDALSLLGKDELAEVVIDFLGHLRNTSGGFVSGKVSTKDLVTNVINIRNIPEIERATAVGGAGDAKDQDEDSGPEDVWSRLEKRPVEQVAEYLNKLPPNLVAIVINKLSVTMSSEIFNCLEDEKLKAIMGHMVEAKEIDPRIGDVVGRMIKMEFLNAEQDTSGEDVEHLSGIGELLSLIPSGKRDTLVKFLESDHANIVNDIQSALFTIDSLPDTLPRSAVPIVFRDMDIGEMVDLLSTLQGGSKAVFDFLLGNISSRLADQIKDKLSGHSGLSSEASEESQRNFLMRIMALKRRGDIVT